MKSKLWEISLNRMFEKSKIIKDRKILSPIYIPPVLQDRNKEMNEIAFFLQTAIQGWKPPDLLVLGVPGSGKTVCIKYALEQLKKKVDITAKYLSRTTGTPYQVITDIARACDINVPLRGIGFIDVWKLLKKKTEEKITIFVLDEFDKFLLKRGEELLYYFSRNPNICTVGVSNKLTVMHLINDARVLSSFNPRKITFTPYNVETLREILMWRAERAFYPNVLEEEVLPFCAALAAQREGDARYALDLLTFAAENCIKNGGKKVTEDDVGAAEKEVEIEFIRKTIAELGLTQKILLLSLLNSTNNNSAQIYEYYNKVAEVYGGKKLTHTRLSQIVKGLELLGLVKIERIGRGWKKGTGWMISLPSDIERELFIQVLERALL